jgi:hypothetical protein
MLSLLANVACPRHLLHACVLAVIFSSFFPWQIVHPSSFSALFQRAGLYDLFSVQTYCAENCVAKTFHPPPPRVRTPIFKRRNRFASAIIHFICIIAHAKKLVNKGAFVPIPIALRVDFYKLGGGGGGGGKKWKEMRQSGHRFAQKRQHTQHAVQYSMLA